MWRTVGLTDIVEAKDSNGVGKHLTDNRTGAEAKWRSENVVIEAKVGAASLKTILRVILIVDFGLSRW